MQLPSISTILKIFSFPRTLDIRNIGYTKMMKCTFFFLFSLNLHIRLQWKTIFAKPMFEVNEPLLIPKEYACDVVEYLLTWHGIFFHVIYSFPHG